MVKRTDTLTDTRQQETDRPLAIRPAKLQLLQEILHLCACVRVHIYTYILHTHTHTHTHTGTHTHTHTHTHRNMHARTHIQREARGRERKRGLVEYLNHPQVCVLLIWVFVGDGMV